MAFGPSVHQGITMNSKAREAMRFIEAFLSLLLDKRVPVNWGSHAGMSCEGSITLPTPVTGDDAEVALLTRLAMHEAGHVEETEQGYSDRLTAEELGVFNVLEDPRMEAARCDKYPGASILLSRGLGEMLRTLRDKVLSNEGSTVDAWRIDLLLRSFLAVAPHAPIREHAGDILNGLAPHISDVQRQAIDGALPIVATLKSSREAESLATSIVKQLREPEPPPLPPPQGDNGGDESEDQGAREPSASDGGEPGDQQQSNPDQEPEAGNDREMKTPTLTVVWGRNRRTLKHRAPNREERRSHQAMRKNPLIRTKATTGHRVRDRQLKAIRSPAGPHRPKRTRHIRSRPPRTRADLHPGPRAARSRTRHLRGLNKNPGSRPSTSAHCCAKPWWSATASPRRAKPSCRYRSMTET
jgi:hypothetical protein